MLKILVTEEDSAGNRSCTIETSGPMLDNVAELALAVRRMHMTLSSSSASVGETFKTAVMVCFSDPGFWEWQPKGKILEQTAILGVGKFGRRREGP